MDNLFQSSLKIKYFNYLCNLYKLNNISLTIMPEGAFQGKLFRLHGNAAAVQDQCYYSYHDVFYLLCKRLVEFVKKNI